MKKSFLLGIDGGTECMKSGIYDLSGKLLGIADFKYDTFHQYPGWAEQKIEDWKEGLIKSIKNAIKISGVHPEDIIGVGSDATGCSVVFIDENNKPLRKAIIWMDVRATEEASLIESIDDPARKYNGYSKVSPEWFPCKSLWVKKNQPEIYKNARIISEFADWLTHELTGNWTSGIAGITFRAYYDSRNGGWPKGFYKKMGLDDIFDKLPHKIMRLGEYVGGVRKEIAKQTGLVEGTPVGQGAFDAACGIVGSNAFSTGQIFLIAGSSNYIQMSIDKEFHKKGIFGTYPDVIINNFAIEGGQISTGSILKWYTSNFINSDLENKATRRGLDIYGYMDLEAEKIPLGSEGIIVIDHWQGNRTPFIDPNSRGIIRGLSLKHTPVHIYRAIMEAIAYGTEATLRVIKESNFKLDEIIACGGHIKSKLWTQIYADVTGLPLKVTNNPEATTLGSAILGGIAAKKFSNLKEAADRMVKFDKKIIPNMENHKKYKFFVDQYIKTYFNLKDIIYETNKFISK